MSTYRAAGKWELRTSRAPGMRKWRGRRRAPSGDAIASDAGRHDRRPRRDPVSRTGSAEVLLPHVRSVRAGALRRDVPESVAVRIYSTLGDAQDGSADGQPHPADDGVLDGRSAPPRQTLDRGRCNVEAGSGPPPGPRPSLHPHGKHEPAEDVRQERGAEPCADLGPQGASACSGACGRASRRPRSTTAGAPER